MPVATIQTLKYDFDRFVNGDGNPPHYAAAPDATVNEMNKAMAELDAAPQDTAAAFLFGEAQETHLREAFGRKDALALATKEGALTQDEKNAAAVFLAGVLTALEEVDTCLGAGAEAARRYDDEYPSMLHAFNDPAEPASKEDAKKLAAGQEALTDRLIDLGALRKQAVVKLRDFSPVVAKL